MSPTTPGSRRTTRESPPCPPPASWPPVTCPARRPSWRRSRTSSPSSACWCRGRTRSTSRWIRQAIAENRPFDRFARELVTAEGPLAEVPQAGFYKVLTKPGDAANTLSQVFLGVRVACAECHHHPFDRWSQTDYYSLAAFFSPVGVRKLGTSEVVAAQGESTAK